MGGRLVRIPALGALLTGGASLAQGKDIGDASLDAVISGTGADIIKAGVDGITKPATNAMNEKNKLLEEALKMFEEDCPCE